MYVLVTGATGFVGFHTVKALLEAGHAVRLGVRSVEKMRRVYEPHGIDTSDHAIGEITDEAAVEASLDGVDAVVHTAAVVELDVRRADYVYRTNVLGTKLVIGGAARRGLQSIVYVSSVTALYDRHQSRITEELPLGPAVGGYARSKVDSERIVEELQAKGAPIAITYPTTVRGPDDPGLSEGNKGIKVLMEALYPVTTSGQQTIDVRDLARSHVLLLEGRKTGRYIAAGSYLPHREFAELLAELTGQRIRQLYVPRFALRVIGNIMDLAIKVFGFKSSLTREAVTYMSEWVIADDSKLRREIDIQYRPLGDTLSDTISWMAASGHMESRFADKIKNGQDATKRPSKH